MSSCLACVADQQDFVLESETPCFGGEGPVIKRHLYVSCAFAVEVNDETTAGILLVISPLTCHYLSTCLDLRLTKTGTIWNFDAWIQILLYANQTRTECASHNVTVMSGNDAQDVLAVVVVLYA